MFDNEAENKI